MSRPLAAAAVTWLALPGCSLIDAVSGDSRTSTCSEFACWDEEVVEIPSEGLARHAVITDTNADGVADIVIAHEQGSVIVLPGRGNGEFGEPTALSAIGSEPISDMVALYEPQFAARTEHLIALSRPDEVTIRLSSGAVFESPLGDSPGPLALGDFDGDGAPDVAVGHTNGEISILLQANDFEAQPTRLSNPNGVMPIVSLAAGRFDAGGGCHDLASAQANGTEAQVSVFLCAPESSPMFEEQRNFTDLVSPIALGAAQFTQVQVDEIAIGAGCADTCLDYDVMRVHNGQGQYQGSLVHGSISSGSFTLSDMVVGNFDRQGGPDVVLTGAGGSDGPDFMLAFDGGFPGIGFDEVFEFRPGDSVSTAAIGDYNGDDRDDIVILHPEERLRLFTSRSR